jgi:hypothetical protein
MGGERSSKATDEKKDVNDPESEAEAKAKGRDPQQAKGKSPNKKSKGSKD